MAQELGWRPKVTLRNDWAFTCHPIAWHFGYRTQVERLDEARELDDFISECCPEMVLFDIGAHFGIFSLAALRYGGNAARVVAVEPSPAVQAIFARQIELLGLSNRVRLFKGCCAGVDGTSEFVSTAFSSSRQFVPAAGQIQADRTSVTAITVDSLVNKYALTPTHITIDVEGGEFDVLSGAQETLSKCPGPHIFLELHNAIVRDAGRDPSATLRLLFDHGYRIRQTTTSEYLPDDIVKSPVARIILRKAEAETIAGSPRGFR